MKLKYITEKAGFTLIELLVVISIIALLLSILIPSLRKVKMQCHQVICASNLRQTGLTILLYADDNKSTLPHIPGVTDTGRTSANLYRIENEGLDLLLKPYFGTFKIWHCSAITGAPPFDDPLNTRDWCYSTYFYFPGRLWPDFGTPYAQPISLNKTNNPSSKVMMQDRFSGHLVDKWTKYNHGDGNITWPNRDTNPSSGFKLGELYKDGDGANLLFYDGSVDWYRFSHLDDVGPMCEPGTAPHPNLRVFSKMRR